jgi:CheY-like chemotaxis protein
MLKSLGCRCDVVNDGEDLVETYKEQHRAYYAIITDIVMPRKDGIQAT